MMCFWIGMLAGLTLAWVLLAEDESPQPRIHHENGREGLRSWRRSGP
jgi:hypothetical protein